MTRLGKVVAGVLLLVAVALATMTRWSSAAPSREPTKDLKGSAAPAGSGILMVPVLGVPASQVADTYGDARSGHPHGGIDIPAERGRPVLAAAGGRVERLFESAQGGHTVYVRTRGGAQVHYYAHLDGYAPGLREGMDVIRGQPLGTVGYSGNADPAGPHLHFEVKAIAPGERWYEGRSLNPYAMLTGR